MTNIVDFAKIDCWVFDLDNTLYPRTCDLFAQVDILITQYVMDITGLEHKDAYKIQKDYYRDHGTTMNGLMCHHDIDPDHYLNSVHDIDYSPVEPNAELVDAIDALPGRKFIFTNADQGHARAVLGRLGGDGLFDGVFDIRATDYNPKPERSAYEKFIAAFDIPADRAIMFDDLEKNLKVPHELGMATVHVVPDNDFTHDQVDSWELTRADDQDHIHHITDDLVRFLGAR